MNLKNKESHNFLCFISICQLLKRTKKKVDWWGVYSRLQMWICLCNFFFCWHDFVFFYYLFILVLQTQPLKKNLRRDREGRGKESNIYTLSKFAQLIWCSIWVQIQAVWLPNQPQAGRLETLGLLFDINVVHCHRNKHFSLF